MWSPTHVQVTGKCYLEANFSNAVDKKVIYVAGDSPDRKLIIFST